MQLAQEKVCRQCKIYEAEITHHPTWKFSIAVNEDEEKKLQEDIALGRKLITLGRILAEVDCARARDLADTSYA
ncbi:MAG: hypothetical protein KKC99_06485 [Proteobacteria bacterium]|nr:hypothetical protein [Pseudomonadota bacterium]